LSAILAFVGMHASLPECANRYYQQPEFKNKWLRAQSTSEMP
jgi:hypothetical protein